MQQSLKTTLTTRQLNILIDKYVRQHSADTLTATYGAIHPKLDVIKKLIIYEQRKHYHFLTRYQILFDEQQLISRVWREHIYDELELGKTTKDISEELKVPLEDINIYVY